MKTFQDTHFDLFNCVLSWATHTDEEQSKTNLVFFPFDMQGDS